MYCRCGSAFPLAPGEECQICGHVAALENYAFDTNPMTSRGASAVAFRRPTQKLFGTRFYYQSQVDFKPGTKIGIWKRCGHDGRDEQYCMQMARLNFNVKKVVYD